MKARLLLAVLFTMFVMGAYASKPDSLTLSKWKIGVATGYHGNVMRFPGLSQEFYYDRDMGSSALILLSAEYTLPKNFSIRPEIGFLNRGGTQYLRNVNEVRKGIYNLKATYFDIRVPVIYNIPLRNSNLQPYIYVAPVAGFVAGGKIKYDESLKSGKENRYNLDLSHSTIASSYFACMVGAGVKYPVTILGINCSVGLELGYEYGFTNTYSRMERHNESIHINHAAGDVAGPRKNSGFEVKASLQVPLTIFQRREKPQREKIVEKIVEKVVEYVPVPQVDNNARKSAAAKPAPEREDRPCYTLEEIQSMLQRGEEVYGKTICAVNDILFDSGKSVIKDGSKAYLRQIADVVIETGLYVEVKGHTDNTGPEDLNLRLSKARALVVMEYLKECGVSPKRISYAYYGEDLPLSTNETEEGRRLNRRVEFELIKR